jgi:hypothetical protein
MESAVGGDPSRFHVQPERAAAYTTTHTNFMDAYRTYHTDATHSTPYRVKKDVMKAHLVNSTRELCETFLADRSLDATTLALVGLKRRDRVNTPVTPPSTPPLVQGRVDSATGIKLTFRNAKDPDRRAKPAGVRQVAVATFTGDTPPTDVRAWGQPTLLGRTDKQMTFNTQSPITVWVTAWWISSRNDASPASAPLSFRIAGTSGAIPQQQESRPSGETMKIAA